MQAEQLIGQTIAGYRVLQVLGRGGMSIVFLAQSLDKPQDQVAIKVLVASNISTPEELLSFQARFLREAQAAYQLHHEHILPVLGYGVASDLFYMIMPVITGGTLAHLLAARQGRLPLAEIAGYLNQLASAVDYAHEHALIHRDIKPSNVLLNEQGNVYLVDFGIVHLFDTGPYAVDEAPTTLTTMGKMYGTPIYMAPERFKGEQAEPATDIYALGILLYQLVTGQVPFQADNPLAIGMKHLSEVPLSPRSLRPELPEPAEAAILRAIAKQPSDRFVSASALAAAFDAGLKGQWTEGVLPLSPLVQPGSDYAQRAQPQLAPIVPVPEDPGQTNPLVLGSVPPSFRPEVPGADEPTQVDPLTSHRSSYPNRGPYGPLQADPAPLVFSPPRSRPLSRILLAGASLAVLASLVLLLLLGGLFLSLPSSPSSPDQQIHPTSTSGVPIGPGVTPTSPVKVTPALSPATTPTHRPKSSPTPDTTPVPTPTSGVTPVATPSPILAPTPTLTPKVPLTPQTKP